MGGVREIRGNYDEFGRRYTDTRRPDPRIDARIRRAVGDGTVVNIGAGGGSYEPPSTLLAVDPSRLMLRQRPARSAPAVCAVAEELPLRANSVDVALAVLTIHHWTDLEKGVAEMARVARRRLVIFSWDSDKFREFWLVSDYLPAAGITDARLAVDRSRLENTLAGYRIAVEPVPVPWDCVDGFGAAFWRRPHMYLDERVRKGMSLLARTPAHLLRPGLDALAADLDTGQWQRKHRELLAADSYDAGYYLMVVELDGRDRVGSRTE